MFDIMAIECIRLDLHFRLYILLALIISSANSCNDVAQHYHLRVEGRNIKSSPVKTVQSRTTPACAWSCSVYVGCKSFLYSPGSGLCDLHLDVFTAVDTLEILDKARYYVLQVSQPRQNSNTNVHARQSICLSGICRCEVGMPYDPNNDTCVERCGKYGTSFTVYKGHSIKWHNDVSYSSITLQECQNRCSAIRNFTCKSFDYTDEGGYSLTASCYLSSKGYFDVPIAQRWKGQKSSAWSLGVRHCQ